MTKKSKTPQEILNAKIDKLDYINFNLLENMFIFCVNSDRSAPKESNVRFRIGYKSDDKSISILFKIDRDNKDPLIIGEGIQRPDYMALYIKNGECLCTIIEMKGITSRGTNHGIDQIISLKNILLDQIKTHLPSKLWKEIKFQALLLTRINAQIPHKKIDKEAKNNLIILPLQHSGAFEIINYISKPIKTTKERYIHEPSVLRENDDEDLKFIESIFTKNSLPERMQNNESYSMTVSAKKPRNKEPGVNVHFKLSGEEEFAVLKLDNSSGLVGIKEDCKNCETKIRRALNKLKLSILKTKLINSDLN